MMTVLVTDNGFETVTLQEAFDWSEDQELSQATILNIPNTLSGFELVPYLGVLQEIRIPFPSFADGRGFTIAKNLRRLGFKGHLRAQGHVLADQYAMARRSGFDDVVISDELAARQLEEQWLFRANWRDHDYQSRLQASS